jgi:uncharacterized protein (DUF433 family)
MAGFLFSCTDVRRSGMESDMIEEEPHITRCRIAVRDIVVWHERTGMSIDEIIREYGLTRQEIDAALSYYRNHRAEIDEAIRVEEESERRWDDLFAASTDFLAERAAEALADYRAGRTHPLDPGMM